MNSPDGASCRPGSTRSNRSRCRSTWPASSIGSRLRYVRQTGPAILARAREEGWDYAHLLKVLFAEEAAGRDRSTREMHRKAARLPSGRRSRPGTRRHRRSRATPKGALRTLDWVGRAENLVLVGPSGTGRSHFAEAIAHAAIDRDLRVSWFSLESLTATIARSRIDASTGKVVERIVRSELVVVDDIGLLPAGADEAEALYRLVDAAYEKRSLILTSNLHPARFDTIFPFAWQRPRWIASSTTPTSSSPKVDGTASPRRSRAEAFRLWPSLRPNLAQGARDAKCSASE